MALTNLLGEIALDSTLQNVKTSVDSADTHIQQVKTSVDTVNTSVQNLLTDTQLRASPLPLPDGAATDVVLQELRDLSSKISELTEVLTLFMGQQLRAMPRKDQSDRVAVYLESLGSGLTLTTVANVANFGTAPTNGIPFAQTLSPVIYDNLKVT